MPDNQSHPKAVWVTLGQQLLSIVVGIIIAAFFIGSTRQKVAQKITTLEAEVAAMKVEWKAEKQHITQMDLEGSVATKNFVANYDKKQASQDATTKEIIGEIRHLELMKAQIDRLERKVDDGKGKP